MQQDVSYQHIVMGSLTKIINSPKERIILYPSPSHTSSVLQRCCIIGAMKIIIEEGMYSYQVDYAKNPERDEDDIPLLRNA